MYKAVFDFLLPFSVSKNRLTEEEEEEEEGGTTIFQKANKYLEIVIA
jgi:hypothetical protein